MAPLSRQLSGVILPHEHYGTHLDGNGKTIDIEFEQRNFEYAGETLANIFGGLVIDGYPVITEYIKPENENHQDYEEMDEKWKINHVRSSQYFLQIVKCSNQSCCSPPRSSFFDIFHDQFLPAPISFTYDPKLRVADPLHTKARFATLFQTLSIARSTITPYDKYCPSIASIINERVCIDCNLYCASIDMLKKHRKGIHNRIVNTKKKPKKVISRRKEEALVQFQNDLDWVNIEDLDIEEEPVTTENNETFNNLFTVEEHLE